MLKSRVVAKALISMVHDDGIEPKAVADSFLEFVSQNNLVHQLPTILFHLTLERDNRARAGKLSLRVSEEISSSLIEDIKKYVGASKDAETETVIDKSLIGGFIAEYKNILHDASLSSVLEKLRLNLMNQQ